MEKSMSIKKRVLQFAIALFVAAVGLGVNSGQNDVQDLEILLDVGEVTAHPGEVVEIPVYFSNYIDTIAGLNFWVQFDRPDIMQFNTVIGVSYDTTWWLCTEFSGIDCIDSVNVPPSGEWDFYYIDTSDILLGNLDSTGTLVSDWQWLDAYSLGGFGHDLNVIGLANMPSPPDILGITPQENGLLIKLVGQVYDIPDTMSDRTVNIMVQTDNISHFGLSDRWGNSLGIVCDTIPDTSFWLCTNWVGEDCLNWTRVSGPPYDSISIDDYDLYWHLDASTVQILDGSVTVLLPILYGDANCNGQTDISDLVYMIDYMFGGGPSVSCLENVDCDEDDQISITDLVCLIDWMFPPQ
jgi:hypothetical protein